LAQPVAVIEAPTNRNHPKPAVQCRGNLRPSGRRGCQGCETVFNRVSFGIVSLTVQSESGDVSLVPKLIDGKRGIGEIVSHGGQRGTKLLDRGHAVQTGNNWQISYTRGRSIMNRIHRRLLWPLWFGSKVGGRWWKSGEMG